MTAREQFEELCKRRLCALQRSALVDTIASIEHATLGDVMSCLDESAYVLEDDDGLTVGDLLGRPGEGPRLVEVLDGMGLPLDSPLDVASPSDRASALALFLSTNLSVPHGSGQLGQYVVGQDG